MTKKELVMGYRRPCCKCGEEDLTKIQFHHIDPTKKLFDVSSASSKADAFIEIKKCVCLCKRCHSEFHRKYSRGNGLWGTPEHLLEFLGGTLPKLCELCGEEFTTSNPEDIYCEECVAYLKEKFPNMAQRC